jgi:hypothetical protein
VGRVYPGLIERVSLSAGGKVTSVDPKARTVVTDFHSYKPAVANVIPPQQSGSRIGDVAAPLASSAATNSSARAALSSRATMKLTHTHPIEPNDEPGAIPGDDGVVERHHKVAAIIARHLEAIHAEIAAIRVPYRRST